MALDSKKPPSRSKTNGCPYFSPTTLGERTPSNGSSESGTKEATGMGTASKIHQRAVHKAIPKVRAAAGSNPLNFHVSPLIIKDRIGAPQRAKAWCPWNGFLNSLFSWVRMLEPSESKI